MTRNSDQCLYRTRAGQFCQFIRIPELGKRIAGLDELVEEVIV